MSIECKNFPLHQGIWQEVRHTDRAMASHRIAPQAALFLDRDGVLNVEEPYLCDPDKVVLEQGVVEALRALRQSFPTMPFVIVTNQSGIARGYFSWDDFHAVQQRLHDLLEQEGISIAMVLACPFHPHAKDSYYAVENHPDCKPHAGMIQRAVTALSIDRQRSWIVGDSLRDIEAGYHAGLRGAVHLATGHGQRDRHVVEHWYKGKEQAIELVVAQNFHDITLPCLFA